MLIPKPSLPYGIQLSLFDGDTSIYESIEMEHVDLKLPRFSCSMDILFSIIFGF